MQYIVPIISNHDRGSDFFSRVRFFGCVFQLVPTVNPRLYGKNELKTHTSLVPEGGPVCNMLSPQFECFSELRKSVSPMVRWIGLTTYKVHAPNVYEFSE